jgi:hypothetical protein
VADATWRAATRIETRVGDLVRRIGDDQAQVEYLVAEGSGGRVTPCAIRIVHVEETRSAGFPVWASKMVVWFVSGLATKPLGQFLGLGLKTKVDGLVIWASKSP